MSQTWSPQSSPYLLKRQAAMTVSTLTVGDGVLTWEPAGVPPAVPGGAPFTVRTGTGQGEADELVWVRGLVLIARPSLHANVLAVCGPGPQGQRVLGYLLAALVEPMTSAASPEAPEPESLRRAEAIAVTAGLRFRVATVPYGQDPNLLFPGSQPLARRARLYSWLPPAWGFGYGLVALVGGVWLAIASESPVPALVGPGFAAALCGFGVWFSPPMVRRRLMGTPPPQHNRGS